VPPHAPQVPATLVAVSRPEQTSPVSHVPVLPAPQHDCAEPPQVEQVLPEDFSTQDPEVHGVAPVQQACPSAPHALQVPGVPDDAVRPEQAKPALQVPLLPVPQQDCPEPPQVPHRSPLAETKHESPVSHVPPPPPPGQQDWPEAPHALHVPVPPSASVKHPRPLWQLLPPQQAAPAAPPLSQVPVPTRPPVTLQHRPVPQALPEQQGSPELPQEVQI